jgi:hypothetical protein
MRRSPKRRTYKGSRLYGTQQPTEVPGVDTHRANESRDGIVQEMEEVSDALRDLTTNQIQKGDRQTYVPPNDIIALALARVEPKNTPKGGQYVTVETDQNTTILYRANIIGSSPNPPWYTILVDRKNTGVSARIDARYFDSRLDSIGDDARDMVFEHLIKDGVDEHVIWSVWKKVPAWIPKLKKLFYDDVVTNNPTTAKFKRMDIIMLFLDTIGMEEKTFTYNDVTVEVHTFPKNPLSFMSFVNRCCQGDTGFKKIVVLGRNRELKFVANVGENEYYLFPCSKIPDYDGSFRIDGNILLINSK